MTSVGALKLQPGSKPLIKHRAWKALQTHDKEIRKFRTYISRIFSKVIRIAARR